MWPAGTPAVLLIPSLVLVGPASGDLTGAVAVQYVVNAEDFGGETVQVNVVDLYMTSNDSADVLLNVYGLDLNQGKCEEPNFMFFQSLTSTGWLPENPGGPFDTEALQRADSFVTIGGFGFDALQTPGAGSATGLDPHFGGNNAAFPDPNGSWYNGSPPNLNGQVQPYDSGMEGVLIARFASTGIPIISRVRLSATWNQGLGTSATQAEFIVFGNGGCGMEGDLIEDQSVDARDLGYILAVYGTDCSAADLDEDGVVGSGDIGLLLAYWGNDCSGFEGRRASESRSERTPPTYARTPDLDGNGHIDEADLEAWKHGRRHERDACDLNGDGHVNGADLGLLLAAWGDAPRNDYPPSDCPLGLIP